MGRYPFEINEVAMLLHLEIKYISADGIYTDCPFCNKKGKLNMHRERQVYRCNYCGAFGNILTLYADLFQIPTKEAYWKICEHLHCGTDNQNTYTAPIKKMKTVLPDAPLADIEIRNHTYTQMLKLLFLSKSNRRNLEGRGLTNAAILKNGYVSTPTNSTEELTHNLIQQGCSLKGVPGFFQTKSGVWKLRTSQWSAGFYVPIRDCFGRIQGMQIRLNHVMEYGTKYIWLSSAGYKNGSSPGSPVHIAGNACDETMFVTEGALKADISHMLTGRTFVAGAGANQYKSLTLALNNLKANGVRKIIECYDIDKFKNIHVMRGCIMLCFIAQKLGLKTKNLAWDIQYKGIDDVNYALNIGEIKNASYAYYDILSLARKSSYEIQDFIEMYDLSLKYTA